MRLVHWITSALPVICPEECCAEPLEREIAFHNLNGVAADPDIHDLFALLFSTDAPELPDDAKDVVFNVAARFPIKFMEPGVAYDGMPLDVQAFVKEVEDELGRLGFKV